MNKRRSIYLGEPLMRLAAEISESKSGGFSRKLCEIVERYRLIMDLEVLPDFTSDEIDILRGIIIGEYINSRKVRGLHLDVLSSDIGEKEELQILSKKIETLTAGQRLALIEKITKDA